MKRVVFYASYIAAALAFCPAQAVSPPALKPTASPVAAPAAIDLLPDKVAYEAGTFFLLVDTGHGTKPVLKPSGFDSGTSGTTASSEKALRIEALAVLPSAIGAGQTGLQALSDTMRVVSRILNSVHTMEGIEYWSASRRVMRTLYAEAYRIDSPSKRSKLPDPLAPSSSSGDSQLFYAYLRDLTFGGNVMKYEVHVGAGFITMTNENVSTVKYYLLPLASPGNMKSGILIVPCSDGLLVHFLSTIDASDMLEKRVLESAGNKALAVLGWFAKETAAAGLTRKPELPKNIEEVKRIN
ncbi:MAG TPA: DUF6675 family protein [Rectinemataceae bacterium]|nr:DUF6675 family protein [Rectinemataceae bacterium]